MFTPYVNTRAGSVLTLLATNYEPAEVAWVGYGYLISPGVVPVGGSTSTVALHAVSVF